MRVGVRVGVTEGVLDAVGDRVGVLEPESLPVGVGELEGVRELEAVPELEPDRVGVADTGVALGLGDGNIHRYSNAGVRTTRPPHEKKHMGVRPYSSPSV